MKFGGRLGGSPPPIGISGTGSHFPLGSFLQPSVPIGSIKLEALLLTYPIQAMYKIGVEPTEIFNGDRFPTTPISLDGTH